ncbi:MAG: cupredoxin domain-containing protein [Nitrososphaeraceae archaeon]
MIQRFSLFIVLLVVGATSLLLAVQVSTGQTIGEENDTSLEGNIAENNTIILNAAEVGEDETAEQGEDETYRWVDSTGAENPDLNIISNTEYTIKIDNPTDEEHELIIDSESAGNTSEIAESGDIEPGKNVEFNFKADQVGELGYHCKYHPDMMNGTINVS